MKTLLVRLFIVFNFLLFINCDAQYTILHSFNDTTGANPLGDLTLSGSKLYGMTTGGGINNWGCVFSIDTNGNGYKDLLDFDSLNGKNPFGSLTILGGKLYGMTSQGGANRVGCIFSLDTGGHRYKDLLDFDSANGAFPCGNLTFSGSKMYGMTSDGGVKNWGCIFSIDTNGNNYKDLHDFNGGFNGAVPLGSLILYGDRLYGMTGENGSGGNIFSMDTNGSGYVTLLIFDTLQGIQVTPAYYGSLINSGKVLYGITTQAAGNSDIFHLGSVFSIDTDGTNYRNLFDFNSRISGIDPFGSLVRFGKTLYGMTSYEDINDGGNIFSVDTNGTRYRNIYDFGCTTNGGSNPYGSLIFSGSTLYGMTNLGGAYGYGVIFKIDTNAIAGINEVRVESKEITIYPNPNTGTFNLLLSNVDAVCKVEIYNVLGEKVYSETLAQSQGSSAVNLTSQPNGIYLYRVITENGELVGEGKLVKE